MERNRNCVVTFKLWSELPATKNFSKGIGIGRTKHRGIALMPREALTLN